jgi:chemotaxis signal transduction protein
VRDGVTEAHLLVRVGDTDFAFPVAEVREVLRSAQVRLLGRGALEIHGRPVAHVDVRGRTIPVVDLRTDPDGPGDVLLPLWRRQAGVVVDRVVTVLSPDDLVVEPSAATEALPEYAHGVGRTVEAGTPVLLVALPVLPGADQT